MTAITKLSTLGSWWQQQEASWRAEGERPYSRQQPASPGDKVMAASSGMMASLTYAITARTPQGDEGLTGFRGGHNDQQVIQQFPSVVQDLRNANDDRHGPEIHRLARLYPVRLIRCDSGAVLVEVAAESDLEPALPEAAASCDMRLSQVPASRTNISRAERRAKERADTKATRKKGGGKKGRSGARQPERKSESAPVPAPAALAPSSALEIPKDGDRKTDATNLPAPAPEPEPELEPQAPQPYNPPLRCFICLGGPNDCDDELLHAGCACRSDSGLAHTKCRAQNAASKPFTNMGASQWIVCGECKQQYTGQVQMEMAQAHWAHVTGRNSDPMDLEYIMAADRLATAYLNVNDDGETALPIWLQCLASARQAFGDDHEATHAIMNNLATCHSQLGNHEASMELNEGLLASRRRTLGPKDRATRTSGNNLAMDYVALGQLERALALRKEFAGASNSKLAGAKLPASVSQASDYSEQMSLGQMQFATKDFAPGLAAMDEAKAGLRRILGEEHPRYKAAARAMAGCLGMDLGSLGRIVGKLYRVERESDDGIEGEWEQLNGRTVEVIGMDGPRFKCWVVPVGYMPTTEEYVRRLIKDGPGQPGLGRSLKVHVAKVTLLHPTMISIQNLTSAPKWNGTRGVIHGYDVEKERYQVRVPGRKRLLGLRMECCGVAMQPGVQLPVST
eukprot:SAG31_NODE_1472_length_8208_cov_5.179800_4_plen_681_part_00